MKDRAPYIKHPSELVGKTEKYVAEFCGFSIHTDELYHYVGEEVEILGYDSDDGTFKVSSTNGGGMWHSSFFDEDEENDDDGTTNLSTEWGGGLWTTPFSIETDDVPRIEWTDVKVGKQYLSTFCKQWYGTIMAVNFRPELYIDDTSHIIDTNMLASDRERTVTVLDIIVKKEETNDVVVLCESNDGNILVPYTALYPAPIKTSYDKKSNLVYEFKEWQKRYGRL